VIADSIAIDELLLVLKIAFLVLLYLFIWQIVRSASRDIRLPQESMILGPGEPGAQMLAGRQTGGRLVVVKSPTLAKGDDFTLNTRAVTIGRGPENDVELRGDEYASAAHAHVDPRPDGVWLVDRGSTNGTFVNGIRLDAPHRLSSGDVIRVGETQLRFEQ
jgi:pSer/pThr/pTyr-binding forkhead associated (FHA) protein